ncbi:DUF637 domain-containing protein [Acinetobacter sp. WCHA39]|uniref:two-partner secretion domain-containing protein n=1 Tax=Acinetobacter sp. WCHA39 TaxID=2004648 RepID=UPI000B3C187F|nr:DUF637 domain-containing protein [Acinetobacter sp. WCHA39]
MNKNRYRIIYNKARQMFMAVAENAKSQTKTSGQSTSSVATPTSEESFHQLWHVKALVASMSLWMPLSTVYAGMMADTGANAANRPVIGVGQDAQKQNVPVINIQTPNASGVSHNIYKEFDVPTQGAVLNNSRTGAASSIVGSVAANPYLQTGEARIILNEVNSAIASKFEGNLEIAGQQADLIIANPAGINIKGGGFINANKAILTTGKPQLNADGSIKEFVVDQGKITVSANAGSNLGLGGATNNNANYIDLYTRALELNAQLYAKNDIQVITGTNTISADLNKVESKTSTATAPTVAIDVKALGGMYANNIYMVGTEKGLGVNNAGTLQAVNNLVITSAGKIEHSGLISSTSKTQGVVSITTSETGAAGDINSSGSINSNSMLNIDSANNLNVNAKDILINYGGVASSPMLINTKGNLNLAANTRIMNDSVGGDLFVDAANINLGTSSELKSNRGSATIQAQQDLTSSASARLIAAQDLNVLGKGKLSFTNTLLHASLGSINLQAGSSNTQGLIDIQAGTINAAKDLNLSSSGDINLKNLGLAVENSVSRVKNINAYSGQNLKWDNTNIALPQIAGKVQLDAANQMDLIGSTISNKDDINLQANKINLSTALTSQKNINIVSKVNDLILDKAITAQGDINVSALAGNINANSLNAVSSQGKLSVLAQKDINLISLQETTPTPSADKDKVTTKQAILKAEKGITIGSLGEGKLALKAVELTANQGTIQLLGKNGVNLEGNEDIYITGDKGQSRIINTKLTAQDILIENKKADVNLKQTDLLATTGNIAVSSEGETKLVGTNLKASGNIELSAKKNLTIQSTDAVADKHMALNAKNLMYISSELGSPYTNYIANSQTNLTAKGILSMISGSSHVTHNANYTGGAILLEAGSFLMGLSNVQFNATGSDLLKNDAKLNSLNGDLSILQTTNDLVIDPKKQKFTAFGDIDLTAKAGAVKLLGYGGGTGSGSEKIISLETKNGDVSLNGQGVEIQGSKINAKNINIISTKNDLIIDGVKNSLIYNQSNKKLALLKDLKFVNDLQLTGVNNILFETSSTAAMMKAIYGENSIKQLKDYLDKEGEQIKKDIQFFSSGLNGYEHAGAQLKSEQDMNIISNKGILVRGSDLKSLGKMTLEAKGTLDKILTSKDNVDYVDAGILVDGFIDSYELGRDTDSNYFVKEFFLKSYIYGDNGVELKAIGVNSTDNLVVQGAIIKSFKNDVKLQSSNNIILLSGQDQSYDKTTNITIKRNWYGKKKTIETVNEEQNVSSIPVDIYAKNINIRSQGDTVLYSTLMEAKDGGKIDIQAKNIKLLVTDEINRKEVSTRTKSSFWGLKYNDSKSNNSYKEIAQLPVKAKADFINTKSDYDTLIQGAEFKYLKGASVQAGGNIILLPATTKVEEATKKEKNSVVWQSMQDKGSVTETAKLPSFNGPTTPIFQATGGLIVQIPVGEKDQNKVQLRDEIMKLANQPGNAYLKDFVNRKDVDWQKVILAQKDWDYKSQGLTGAGAAIIAVIVVAVTAGAGAAVVGALGGSAATLGGTAVAMTQAAVTSLVTQASVSLINNGGNINQTLKELGSKDSVKNLATSVVTAGLLSQVSTAMNLKPDSTLLSDRLMNNFTTSVGSTLVQTAINGGNLEDNLKIALLSGLAGALQGEFASYIGDNLDKVDPRAFEYVLHKIAHAAAGCAAAAATKASCEAGAIGAGVGEIVAGLMPEPKNGIEYNEVEKTKIRSTGKIIAGVVSAYAGYDVNTAANSADIAIQNNSLVKLASTVGKTLVKSLDELNDLRKAGKSITIDDLKASIKKQGADDLLGIADDLYSIFARNTSNFDRVTAAIDLVVGTDLKKSNGVASRKIEELVRDKAFVQSLAGRNPNTPALPNTPYHPDMVSLRALTQAEKNDWITKLPETIVKQKVTVGGKAIDVDLTPTINRIINNNRLKDLDDGKRYMNFSTPSIPFKQPGMPFSTGKNFEEWTVPTSGISGRGPQRIVVDRDTGMMYYTPNHYGTAATGGNTWRVLGKLP